MKKASLDYQKKPSRRIPLKITVALITVLGVTGLIVSYHSSGASAERDKRELLLHQADSKSMIFRFSGAAGSVELLDGFRSFGNYSVIRSPDEAWAKLANTYSIGSFDGPVAFAGYLKTPSGSSRYIVVVLGASIEGQDVVLSLWPYVLDQSSPLKSPTLLVDPRRKFPGVLELRFPMGGPAFSFLSGTASTDSANATFTLQFSGSEDFVDCWIDDRNGVTLWPRDRTVRWTSTGIGLIPVVDY